MIIKSEGADRTQKVAPEWKETVIQSLLYNPHHPRVEIKRQESMGRSDGDNQEDK